MTKLKEKRFALQLRNQGKSYSQIKKQINVSKSSLSLWLRNLPLSSNQLRKLRDMNEIRIEKFRQTMRKKREKRLASYYKDEKKKILPLNLRELYIAGLFLYWGEGNKAARQTVSINNTDPSVLRFSLRWMTKSLKIPENKIKVYLHLYKDMDIKKETSFWSKTLKIPRTRFAKPYIKNTKKTDINHKGYGHGTCGIRVDNTRLKERILMAIKAVSDGLR